MKVLVAYASRSGATEGIAERIASTLAAKQLDVTFRAVGQVDTIGEFDAFVIGSSAYMGRWEKQAAAFVRSHADILASHPVWLFSSGPIGTETVDKQGRDVLETARPKEFDEFTALIRPRDTEVFFGAYDPLRKNATLAERLVMKMPAIAEAMPAGDFRDWPAIEAWAEKIARELTPAGVSA
jgi:menaquinone-dependent protoporphyrinogen oxidase